MLKNSSLFVDAMKSSLRDIRARVKINNIIYDDETLVSINADLGSMAGEEYAIGSAITNAATIVFSEIIETVVALDRVTIEIGVVRGNLSPELRKMLNTKIGTARVGGTRLNSWNPDSDIEYVPLGEFYISDHVDIDYNEKKTTIVCKDQMIFLENDYNSQLKYPADIRDVVTEIANQAGVEIDYKYIGNLSATKIEEPKGYTHRQALGLIAQIEAGFVTFSRTGKLQIRTLQDSDYNISMDEYYSKGLVKKGIRYRVGGITCTVNKDEETLTLKVGRDTGPQINLENDVMTQEILNDVYEKLADVDFYPYALEWRGNPSLEAGDLFTIQDASGSPLKVPNLGYKLVYNGGLKATSEAETKSRTDVKPSGRPTLQQQINKTLSKIKEESSSLKNAFEEANEKITGNRGGYLTARYDENGKPYEFLVMDTEDINSATNVIRLNQEGIGFSQNGYNGPFGVAITIDGHIVADFIDTGILNAGMIQAGFNGIAQGVSMTPNGLKAVAASGEYSVVEEGGMRFFTKTGSRTGAIESGYVVSEGSNGVAVFVEPGKSFSISRKNESTGIYETFLRIPFNEDVIEIPRILNMKHQEIRYVKNIWMQGTSTSPGGRVFDNNGILALGGYNSTSLGWLDTNGGITTVLQLLYRELRAFGTLNMNGNVITNQSDIRLKDKVVDAVVDPFSVIEKMRFINFEWDATNPYNEKKPTGEQFGMEAQYAPFLAVKDQGSNYLSIDMGKQVNINSMALQKMLQTIDELKAENADMNRRLSALEKLVADNSAAAGGDV
ncbi:Hypothetical protein Tcol_2014 [Trichococcus collinsii]|uniref:Peptidase S74 domain-containing protein n=1 Tax=Trichococcus collinsii TaxID=157076 RepID=A0AB37ZXA4_9LACT|nr:Hypothetical protein Tcol_2014 [Trichococcus collinsii]SDZ94061.1 hypothetical protein SAMN04488525_101678 [Trichococcus collinsii]